ncbi:response regulator transcription factor [Chitinophaga niabensis]|uniref:DNA-binding response regulator, OmpR family, contains REC and winged-helix (WHTH) domain n=1 Tax=Chitinophaga niabensis TaxID=536979 RepID=A0A1N6DW46_9BACT|nr:response regulator [Chitinophaga niabensis]SIN74937.1 DNA-binding response regulator, OmpR family, contains REC and winged-helix (wHTH) domain [Chitinophaga niabensis]
MQPVILLVDDNEEIIEFVSSILQAEYTILSAENGEEAIAKLHGEMVDLVISDVMMPVMDGFELCKRIKTAFEISHIPVILLTAKNTLQSKIEGLEIGADAYIEKPFSPAYLKVQIANLLSNRHKVRQYFANTPLVHINTIAHTREDEAFLEKIYNCILEEIENTELDVEHLCKYVNMSRISLYRKIKAISDLTPHELINITRLKKAAELLSTQQYKIYEVAMMTGYKSQTHFGKNFIKQFGVSPSQYILQKK